MYSLKEKKVAAWSVMGLHFYDADIQPVLLFEGQTILGPQCYFISKG